MTCAKKSMKMLLSIMHSCLQADINLPRQLHRYAPKISWSWVFTFYNRALWGNITMKHLPLVRDVISPSDRARGWRQSFWENGQSNTLGGRRRSRRKALRHLKWSVEKTNDFRFSCLIGNVGLSLIHSPKSLDGRTQIWHHEPTDIRLNICRTLSRQCRHTRGT